MTMEMLLSTLLPLPEEQQRHGNKMTNSVPASFPGCVGTRLEKN